MWLQVLTKEFNQLAGTMESVELRIAHLAAFLDELPAGPLRSFFCTSLVETAINNAGEMMIQTPKFGFPVAMVLTSMFARAAELPALMRGMLKSAAYGCPLCVPQFTPLVDGTASDAWKRANGYKCAFPCPCGPR